MDENYLVVGNYIEEGIKEKIENGEYVDFPSYSLGANELSKKIDGNS